MNNKTYNKTCNKIDRIFTWDSRNLNYKKHSSQWIGEDYSVLCGIVNLAISGRVIHIYIINHQTNKTVSFWCETFAELRNALNVVELLG